MKAKENKVKYKEKVEKAISLNQQFRLGGARYVAFIIADLLCLIGASVLTTKIYLVNQGKDFVEHIMILVGAIFIDVFVTLVFNTLNRVLRRSAIREVVECLKHVLLCFVSLSFCLFMTKRGAVYSRLVVFLTYAFDFLLILILRSLLKFIINKIGKRNKAITSLVLTTDAFVAEAVESLRNKGIVVKDKHWYRVPML